MTVLLILSKVYSILNGSSYLHPVAFYQIFHFTIIPQPCF